METVYPDGNNVVLNVIKYAHNTYGGRTRKIPSEDTFFYFRKRRRTSVRMTENDGACWVRANNFVIDDGVTSIGNALDVDLNIT